MMDYRRWFYQQGQGCDDQRVNEMEVALGRVLPDAYRQLIKNAGGGLVATDLMSLPEEYAARAHDYASIFMVYGNGKTASGPRLDLDLMVPELVEQWELPEWGLPFAEGEIGPAQSFLINYDNPAYPVGAIIYVYQDIGCEVLLAAAFEEFCQAVFERHTESERIN
ncbi:SMI1/KNR4 family protein [Corynebacterium cystitidis]|uniref:SMI1/KNR4 family protein n=2 Tax=Corynebacterium cystitidis TaxID=35757 RepID=UPI00211F2F17|nr:SMI1/KNR4 family protein [Corynebacterium cystitidis]